MASFSCKDETMFWSVRKEKKMSFYVNYAPCCFYGDIQLLFQLLDPSVISRIDLYLVITRTFNQTYGQK